jgi:hypothetical protein
LKGSDTLPSFSLPTVTHDISYLLVVPAIKHLSILAGGLTLLGLAAFFARFRRVFSEITRRPGTIRADLLGGGHEYRKSNGLAIRIALAETTRSEPGAAVVTPLPNEIEHSEPAGVNWTTRKSSPITMSSSSRHSSLV